MFKQAGEIPSNVLFNKEWTDHWNQNNESAEQKINRLFDEIANDGSNYEQQE